MDSTQTTIENCEENVVQKSDEQVVDISKIENMVTPEQVYSDTVARKRRKFTKKRNSSLTKRAPTPTRNMDEKMTTSDEEITDKQPITPERRHRRRNKSLGMCSSENELEYGKHIFRNGSAAVSRSSSFGSKQVNRKKSLSDMAHEEMTSLLEKTKKSITAVAHRGRERFKKNSNVQAKRSQSAPHNFTKEELIERLEKAKLLQDESNQRMRKYSDSNLQDIPLEKCYTNIRQHESKPEHERIIAPRIVDKSLQDIVKITKSPQKRRQFSSKIIEILDPKSNKVIARKSVIKPEFRLVHLFHILHMYTPLELYRAFKSYKEAMRTEYRLIRILWNKSMFQLFLIIMFCGIGGIIFKFTEGSFENYYKCGVKRVRRDFIDQLWTKSHNLREEDWKSLARNRLRIFEEEIHAAHEAGMTSYSGQRSWSFLNAVVYALTMVTTIGYGHLYPSTTTGMALTIVYSLIGIPLFLIALTDFGKLFTRGIKFLWSFVRRLYYTGSCRQVRKTAHVQEIFKGAQMMYEIATFRRPSQTVDPENADGSAFSAAGPNLAGDDTPTTPAISNFEIDDEFNLPISLALFILIAYIFIGALGFYAVEDWSFFASFYFVFISMSTIGFGDYVPRNPIAMIASIVYLCFGLALMSMCINVVQDKLSDTFKQASAKIGATIGIETAEEESVAGSDQVEMPGVHGATPTNQSPSTPHSKDDDTKKPNHLKVPER